LKILKQIKFNVNIKQVAEREFLLVMSLEVFHTLAFLFRIEYWWQHFPSQCLTDLLI